MVNYVVKISNKVTKSLSTKYMCLYYINVIYINSRLSFIAYLFCLIIYNQQNKCLKYFLLYQETLNQNQMTAFFSRILANYILFICH